MKLSQNDKDILREKVEEELESVKEGERVHIDKEVLEELLFDEVILQDKDKKIIVKFPEWSGQFLRKIDLSEVSFDNVLWPNCECIYGYASGYGYIDYSYTNAKIDFEKSANFLSGEDEISIERCNFSGLDLTALFSSTKGITMVACILQNAKIFKDVNNSEFLKKHAFGICDLTGVDLSHFTVDIREIIDEVYGWISGCVLTNTGLNITMSDRQFGYDYEEMCETSSCWNKETFNEFIAEAKQYLAGTIQTDGLAGCYLNGKLIHSRKERKAEGQRRLQEYNEMRDRLTAKVLSGIKTKKLGTK